MPTFGRSDTGGQAALSALLFLCLIPVGGRLWWAHPVLLLLATLAVLACFVELRRREARAHPSGLLLVLCCLAVWTTLQTIPVGDALGLLSPRAADLRGATLGMPQGPVSYEAGETALEASKLCLYAMVAFTTTTLVRRRSSDLVLKWVVFSGLASVFVGLGHAVFGWRKLFGIWETHTAAADLLSTFANPNHAAGALLLCGFVAVGLGIDGPKNRRGYLLLGTVLFAVSLYQRSTGATLALVIGLVAFVGMLLRQSRWRRSGRRRLATLAAAGTALGVVAVVGSETVRAGFSKTVFDEKFAAFRYAPEMIWDHFWFGIGRGAYRSVYTGYVDEPLRLVHTHPETLPIQFISEWGAPIGVAATAGLLLLTVHQLLVARSKKRIAVAAGVLALVCQNMVDFSLELTGVALICVALLSTLGPREQRRSSSELRLPLLATTATGFICLAWGTLAYAAWVGDLRFDVQVFEAHLLGQDDVLGQDDDDWLVTRTGTHEELEQLGRRAAHHPANPFGWTALAHVYARRGMRSEALQTSNKAMFTAPTYAPPHELAGSLLWAAGHRTQAIFEYRRAWTLSPLPRELVDRMVRLFDPTELARAIPRATSGSVEPRALSLALRTGLRIRNPEYARVLLENVDVDAVFQEDHHSNEWVHLLLSLGAEKVALRVAREAFAKTVTAGSEAEADAIVHTLIRFGHHEVALSMLLLEHSNNLSGRFCLRAAELMLIRGDAEAAIIQLDGCAARTTQQEDWVLLRAQADETLGRLQDALRRIEAFMARHPMSLSLRRRRGRVLLRLGRTAEARLDAQFVLRRSPNDPEAKRIMEWIQRRVGDPER
ncbi:MAG: O-antigen ligase family protein [Myxococcota bacterium]